MAHLMAIPIRDKGDAVLIVTNCAGRVLMGFVAETTLEPFFDSSPTTSQCIEFVKQRLPAFERVLLKKSMAGAYCDDSIACVEVEHADLVGAAIAQLH